MDELGIQQPPKIHDSSILKVDKLGIKQSPETQTESPILKVSVKLFGVGKYPKIQSTDNPSEDEFGPHYLTRNTNEPPMDLPIEGLQDDEDIPRNLFFQPIPISDRVHQIARNGNVHKKGIEERILLPISIITLLVSLILLGCSAFGIYQCTKEKRDQHPGQTRCTQTEELEVTSFNAIVNIVDEVSSYSDQSEGSQDKYEKKPRH
ncbi:uncharacterized protein [Erythrolamprus reginae]|uniref:uncharacterized protein isoform X2 n=1 Tax=Erythrolamprus reginae TaxID=121349 RepID=UPI00396CEE4C